MTAPQYLEYEDTADSFEQSLQTTVANAELGKQFGHQLASKARGGVDMGEMIAGGGKGGVGAIMGGDNRGKAGELYRQNRDWPYAIIQAIARRIGGLPFGAGTITKKSEKSPTFAATKAKSQQRMTAMRLPNAIKQRTANGRAIEQIETHEALDFLQRPNRIQGKTEFLQCTILNLFLTGEAYWIGGKTGEGEYELWAIPTSWIIPKHEGSLFSSYVLKMPGQEGMGVPLAAELVRRMYLPDPQDFKSSISPVTAEARAVKIDEYIQQSQVEMFEQGILPQLMVTVGDMKGPNGESLGPPTLTGPQRRQIVKGVREIINSAVRNRDPLIVDALIANVEKMSTSGNEMDWLNSGESVKKRLFQAFGINPIIVGEMQGVNRAQAAVADQSYVDNVVNPLGDKITCALQDFVVPMFESDGDVNTGLALWLEEASAKDDELNLRKINQGRADGAASYNEHRQVLSLAPIESPAGDLVGPVATTAGRAQLMALIGQVTAGQVPANVAQSLMVKVLGLSEADAKEFLKGVKPQPAPGGFPGAPGAPGQGPPPPQGGGGAGPPKPAKPPKPGDKPQDEDGEDAANLPEIDPAKPSKALARIVRKAAAAPRLTRSLVKSHISRQRSALESEAAVGLTPFFNRSLSGPLDSLLSEAITSSIRTTRPPSQPG